jgi:hypothetical protein
MGQVGKFWSKVATRAWRRSLELVRLESWERVIVFLIGLIVPALAVWFFVGDSANAAVRALATFGGAGIGAAAMFGWSLIRLPAIMAAEAEDEIEKLRVAGASAEQLRARRVTLGRLLSQGEALRYNCASFDEILEAPIVRWKQETENFLLHEMGEEYLHRFNSDAGAPTDILTSQDVPERNRQLWAWLNKRAYRLSSILEAMPH